METKLFPFTSASEASTLVEEFLEKFANLPNYVVPQGAKLHAKNWQAEAVLRMFLQKLSQGTLHDQSGKKAVDLVDRLVVNSAQDARRIIEHLLSLEEDESLLVQDGVPQEKIKSTPIAPRVLVVTTPSVLGQSVKELNVAVTDPQDVNTAVESDTQSLLQKMYEAFVSFGHLHFHDELRHKLVVSGGLGSQGKTLPLAATMAGATFLGVDVDPMKIEKLLETGFLDKMTYDYHHALRLALAAQHKGEAISIGLVGDFGDVLDKFIQDGITPDVLIDQTVGNEPLRGELPFGIALKDHKKAAQENTPRDKALSLQKSARHKSYLATMQSLGSFTFDNISQLLEVSQLNGKVSFRWAALSGDLADIMAAEEALKELFQNKQYLVNWLDQVKTKVPFGDLPTRSLSLNREESIRAGLLLNKLVQEGKVKAPLAIQIDQLSAGSHSYQSKGESNTNNKVAVEGEPGSGFVDLAFKGSALISFYNGVHASVLQLTGAILLADGTSKADASFQQVMQDVSFAEISQTTVNN